MPYSWVPPEKLLKHRGVTIYHAYKDGGDTRMAYWFTTNYAETGDTEFDVRDVVCRLPVSDYEPLHDGVQKGDEASIRKCLKKAIALGIITEDGVTPEETKNA